MSSNDFDIVDLSRRLANLFRIGIITELDLKSARCRVDIGDGFITKKLPWLTERAGNDRTWWPPEVGEQVIVLSPDGDLANGIVMTGFYQASKPAPSSRAQVHKVEYADGITITHDGANKKLTLDAMAAEGTIEIRAKNIIFKTGKGGFFHMDHYGKASRITHKAGVNYKTESWATGAVVVGLPDHGHSPPEVDI